MADAKYPILENLEGMGKYVVYILGLLFILIKIFGFTFTIGL